ncbi:helix-turn-helix domain-containing protein [Rhodobacterales bacterium HKCCE3408]|nr:helix-turn-helix domain-containing protein [Rhodobacterales bacterium HKCCE3408]
MSLGSGDRLLAILDLFDEKHLEWTPAEMMAATGYTRPTLYRYLKTLRDVGFLTSLPGGGFTLGPRVVELDFLMRKSDPLVSAAAPHLKALSQRFDGVVFLAQWYGEKLLCIASEARDGEARTSYPRGRPMPLSRGAAARIIIAHLPRRHQQALIASHATSYAEVGLGTTEDEVLTVLRRIRKRGVSVARGEVTPGIVGTAAAVLDGGGKPVASVCLSMEAAAHAAEDAAAIETAILDAAAAIAADFARSDLARTGS